VVLSWRRALESCYGGHERSLRVTLCQKLKIPQFPQTPCSFCTQLGRGTSSQEQPPTARTTMRWGRVTVLALVAVLGHVAALDNGAASTPPLGWCSWQRYRCAIACNDSTSINCFNEVRTQVSTLGMVVGVRVLCSGASVCHPCECDSVYANAQKRIIVCPTALSAGHRGHSQQPSHIVRSNLWLKPFFFGHIYIPPQQQAALASSKFHWLTLSPCLTIFPRCSHTERCPRQPHASCAHSWPHSITSCNPLADVKIITCCTIFPHCSASFGTQPTRWQRAR
jgi:hypothetical protein